VTGAAEQARERRQILQNKTPASGTCNARSRRARQASSPGSWSLSTGIGNMLGANPMALSDAIIATYMTIHMAPIPPARSISKITSEQARLNKSRLNKSRLQRLPPE
jgi:hypothetical protein